MSTKQTYLIADKALEKFQGLYRQHREARTRGEVKDLEINMVRDKYAMAAIIDHIGSDALWELLDWYFENYTRPDLTWFIYNYDKVREDMRWTKEDAQALADLRQKTKRRVIDHLRAQQESDSD